MLTVALPEHVISWARLSGPVPQPVAGTRRFRSLGPALNSLLPKLQYALLRGFLPQVDRHTRLIIETHIAGYIYRPEPTAPHVGFGLFKDCSDSGFELWLLGIGEFWRGRGHGRAMIEGCWRRRWAGLWSWHAALGRPS
jgi:ribosomal protein S18 acetylase RimI-like enzyme